jgi:hypothetical protein
MFNPSQTDVRRFFIDAWKKQREQAVLTPLEAIAADWIREHPEYHATFEDPAAVQADFSVERGQSNPFLHLSMHLAIHEQLSIDQPPGIRAAFTTLAARLGSAHEAAHEVMECLGQTVWEAQRSGTVPDSAAYLDCIRRRV